MTITQKKISTLDQKIKDLQGKKKSLQENLDKVRLSNLKKTGLFDLSDNEAYGLIIENLKLKDDSTKRGAWKSQGDNFLSTIKNRSKKVTKQTD